MTGTSTPTAQAEAWARGVAVNPAATPDVLLRLLSDAAKNARRLLCEHRDLPDELIAAILAHPDRAVRAAIARNPFVDPAVRSTLANDPDDLVRAALAGGPRGTPGRRAPLTDAALETLLFAEHPMERRTVTDDEIRSELEGSWQIPHEFRRRALQHPDPRLRAWSTGMWLWLSPLERHRLLTDPDPEVRVAAAHADRLLDPNVTAAELPERDCHARAMLLMNYAISPEVADRCLAKRRNLWALAHNPHTPTTVIARLARDADPKVRERVASRIEISAEQLAALAQDPVQAVRIRARMHPLPRTEAERAAIDRVAGHSADEIGQLHEMYREPADEWYERCATSEHPLLRRVAATHAGLALSTVQRLAADTDPDVRHLLAFNHPDAPPRLLIDAFRACHRQRQFTSDDAWYAGHRPEVPR